MKYICPLISNPTEKVECTTQCALFLNDGANSTCAININAIHTLEVEKKLALIRRDNRL